MMCAASCGTTSPMASIPETLPVDDVTGEAKKAEIARATKQGEKSPVISTKKIIIPPGETSAGFADESRNKKGGLIAALNVFSFGEDESPNYVTETAAFEKGPFVLKHYPKPSYQPIFLVWMRAGKEVQRSLAYHGWDVNFDGQLDMFEGVDLQGKVYIKLFDFNFDGKIDHISDLKSSFHAQRD